MDKNSKGNDSKSKPVKIDPNQIKLSHPETEPEEQPGAEVPPTPAPKPKEKEKIKEPKKSDNQLLKEEIEKLKKELSEAKEKNLYVRAELDNTRKYYMKQADMTKSKTKIDIISEFMPILDSLENAKLNSDKLISDDLDPQFQTFFKGFSNLYQNVMAIFTKLNVKPIEALNQKFDYKYHEAILSQEREDLEEDTIIQVVAPGYTMNGEVIRPAKVIVSKLPPQPETTEEAVESDVPSSDTIEQTDSSATAEMDTSMVTDSESSDTENSEMDG